MRLRDDFENTEETMETIEAVKEVEIVEAAKEEILPDELDGKIQEWKNEYGRIYETYIDEERFIWRRLKRKEYLEILATESEEGSEASIYLRQELMAKVVTLYPTNMDKYIEDMAGLASEIADNVVLKSGFGKSVTNEL